MAQPCRSAWCKNCGHVSRANRENCDVPLARGRIRADFFGVLAGTAPAFWFRVGALSTTYEPRHPAQGLLYQIVRL
jgi:hypothetical protein